MRPDVIPLWMGNLEWIVNSAHSPSSADGHNKNVIKLPEESAVCAETEYREGLDHANKGGEGRLGGGINMEMIDVMFWKSKMSFFKLYWPIQIDVKMDTHLGFLSRLHHFDMDFHDSVIQRLHIF